ncbi:MAG: sugar transferase [Bacteroidota bacterium]
MALYPKTFKRSFDLMVSIGLFIVFLPVFFLTCLLLYIANNGSVFFLQPRPGIYGKIFRVIKFKTMNDKSDANGQLLPDSQRLTAVGAFVRKTSLDEIPQLLNVIKGDMSLVGPRPLLVEYLPLYSATQSLRHNVRPGITGWAQVNGRNAISWTQKFEYDVWYVNHISFALDMKILWMTALRVVKSADINAAGHATIERFKG